MRLTNVEALMAQEALGKLNDLDLPIKTSLDIAIISNMIEQETKSYGVVLQKLYKKHSVIGTPSEDGKSISFECTLEGEDEKAKNMQEFVDDMNELLESKTNELSFKPIKLPSDTKVKPDVLRPLVKFIEVE
jgi:hypothetical protein